MLDRQNGYGIQHRLKTIQREITTRAKFDHQLSESEMFFNRPAYLWQLPERDKRLTDCEQRTLRRLDVFFNQETVQPSNIRLCAGGQYYVWHMGIGWSGSLCTLSTHVLNSSRVT